MAKKKMSINEKPMFSESDSGCGLSTGTSGADRVWFLFGKTINVGNYESVRFEVGRGEMIKKGETFEKCMDDVKKKVLHDSIKIIEMVEESIK